MGRCKEGVWNGVRDGDGDEFRAVFRVGTKDGLSS